MNDLSAPRASRLEKVVIRMPGELIKGYLETEVCESSEDLLLHPPLSPLEAFRVQRLDGEGFEDIPVKDAKAVFFVKTFAGKARHNELKFHSRAMIAHGIWVRIEFNDGEVMEGLVHNSLQFLIDTGFFMLPTDPDSNNKLVYVLKKGLQDCKVLGVRKI